MPISLLNVFTLFLFLLCAYVWLRATERHRAKKRNKTKTKPNEQYGVCTDVIDGDTIKVVIDGRIERVRYIGMNAPEFGQPGYHAATAANKRLVLGKAVRLVSDISDQDAYGRLLRYVYVGDCFVNRRLVQQKKAVVMAISPNTSRIEEIAT